MRARVACFAALFALAWAHPAGAAGRFEEPIVSAAFGTFGGLRFDVHRGVFTNGLEGDDGYRVPFEIIAPHAPRRGNRTLLLEPPHILGEAGALKEFLGLDLVLGRGFSHAQVGWTASNLPLVVVDDPRTFHFGAGAGVIISEFAAALRRDRAARSLVGRLHRVYGVGFSNSAGAIQEVLHTGEAVFDLALVLTSTGDPDLQALARPEGKVIVVGTEADLQLFGAAAAALLDEGTNPSYRAYYVAGAPHISDAPCTRHRLDGTPPLPAIAGTTPIDWTPVARALFLAGDRWVRFGRTPPRSAGTDDGAGGLVDGIRLPAHAVGEASFIPSVLLFIPFPFPLFGGYEDVRSIGDEGFYASYAAYLHDYTVATLDLLLDGYILPVDALRLLGQAALEGGRTATQSYADGLTVPGPRCIHDLD